MPRRKYEIVICPVCNLTYCTDDYEFCPHCAARDIDIEDIFDDDDDLIDDNYNEL